ncbi:hypothetical protein SAMN05720765_10310 [Fibrobacter sp. UWH6]|nr:hypothetical protein SAMN05720765_10310 [Fibrobacter sp. UWH6]
MAIQKRVKWNGNQDDVQSPPAKEQEQIIARQQMIFTAIPLNIFEGLK